MGNEVGYFGHNELFAAWLVETADLMTLGQEMALPANKCLCVVFPTAFRAVQLNLY